MRNAFAALLLAVALAACSTSGQPQTREVTAGDAENGQSVSLHVGDHLRVSLNSTAWTISGSSDASVVQPEGQQVVSPAPPGACYPGMGCGTTTAMFVAVRKGSATISASRVSCGEARVCVGQEGVYQLAVSVI